MKSEFITTFLLLLFKCLLIVETQSGTEVQKNIVKYPTLNVGISVLDK